jgi:hypothetical protein
MAIDRSLEKLVELEPVNLMKATSEGACKS